MTQPVQELPVAITVTSRPDNNVRIGVVTQSAPLKVNVQGGDVVSPGVIAGAHFAVGTNVALLRQDQSWLVLGAIASSSSTASTGQAIYAAFTGADATVGAGFGELDTARMTWVKRLDTTRVRIDLSVSSFSTAVTTAVEFGVQLLDSTSTSVAIIVGPNLFFNIANTHLATSSFGVASGIPAGTYTVLPVWRRVSGAGTVTTDANDWLSYAVSEVD
jgi:hypothetical protein